MANVQPENGITGIANELLEALCRFRMPGEVRQIVDTVFRKTYGWHKTWDKISGSQFVEMTGQSKGNVSRSLSKAITHKLVIKNDNNQLRINKDYDQWVSFKKVIKTATKVIKSDNQKLSKMRDTKETTKETIQNITTNVEASPQNPFIIFREVWVKVFGKPPTGGKTLVDYPISRLIKAYSLEKVCNALMWAEQARQTNQYIPLIKNPKDLEDKWNSLIYQRRKELNTTGGKNYDD